jgi:ferric-dicitrate binding protein FerR (iron transport regulator)
MSSQDPQASSVGDANVERLIEKAYKPESPAADLLPKVSGEMQAAAHAKPTVTRVEPDEVRRLLPLFNTMVAAIVVVALAAHFLSPVKRSPAPSDQAKLTPNTTIAKSISPGVTTGGEGLKAKARPVSAPPQVPATGEMIATEDKGFRLPLPDGSVAFLNRGTAVRVDAERGLTLARGEVFIEVAPQQQSTGKAFVVKAGDREVKALGTKFSVRTDGQGKTAVLVTQGKVQVTGYDQPIAAGQQLVNLGDDPQPAPRASYALDWTRELMTAAETPLVPESKYSGGALIAVDSSGQEAKLSLRKYHVDVHIEDGFARTVIDQTYFNHAGFRMEGTFYFPLPPDASLSRLAMYVDGNLMEGGMAERDYARGVYEQIMWSQKDPALLEWVDGSTFKMRVFPLEARQEKRIIIGYTQRLPGLYGRSQFRFPAGHSLGLVNEWSFNGRVKNAGNLVVGSDSHQLLGQDNIPNDGASFRMKREGNDVVLNGKAANALLARDVTLNLVDPTAGAAQGTARFSRLFHEGSNYVMLRYRPDLKVEKQRQNRDWVFLFESSGDRDPLLARVQIDVIRTLLSNAEHNDTFAILTAGTRVRSFNSQPLPATPENIQEAINFLEGSHLIGALDLNQALVAAQPYLSQAQNPYLVHVGSGIAAMGERRPDVLAKRILHNAHYVGVAVGKRWSRDFMKTAAERTGGYYTQINPDEPVSWRAFELAATLNTPRLMDIKVLPDAGPAKFLLDSTAIAQGEEICAIARLGADDGAMPKSLTVIGTLDGNAFTVPVELPQQMTEAGHLPRTWAKLELDRLLAEDARKNHDRIVELSKQMYVMTPFTSLLVLENDEMYRRFKVDRGRKDHWAHYVTPQKIDVKFEPLDGQPIDARFAPKTEKPHANEILQTIVVRTPPTMLTWPNRRQDYRGRQTTTALTVYRGAFARPADSDLVELEQASLNLINDEIGNDPDHPTNFNIDRIQDAVFAGERGEEFSKSASASPVSRLMSMTGGRRSGRRELGAMKDEALREDRQRSEPKMDSWGRLPERRRSLRDAEFTSSLGDVGGLANGFAIFKESKLQSANQFMGFEGDKRKSLDDLRRYSPVISQQSHGGQGQGAGIDLDDVDARFTRTARQTSDGPRMYGRPSFSQDDRVFYDLVSYLPGMNTTSADIEAALENEASPKLSNIRGTIDPAARPLIENARKAGWQKLTLGEAGATQSILFDGQGRYVIERTTPMGLREEIICDGQTIHHLYPDVGLGARRQVSRFHRAELAHLVPWLVLPIEDLARGADVKKIGDNIVVLIPRGADSKKDDAGKPVPYASTHLVFAADGRLAERRIVENVIENGEWKVKPYFVESYENGNVKLVNGEGKELSKRELKLASATAPTLTRDVSKLVVLPMPWRNRDEAYRAANIDVRSLNNPNESWTFDYLDRETALSLIAAEFATNDSYRLGQLHRRCIVNQGTNQLGFYVLMLSLNDSVAGDPEFRRLLEAEPTSPVARYVGLVGNPVYRYAQNHWGLGLGAGIGPKEHFLTRLATFRDLYFNYTYLTNTDASRKSRTDAFKKGMEFVQANRTSVLGWAMLTILADRCYYPDFHQQVAQAWKLFADESELGYVAKYEQARSLYHAGQHAEAGKHFRELYETMFKAKVLPPIDGTFRAALLAERDGADLWTEQMKKTGQSLLKDKHRAAVVMLAWQCWQLGDAPLAENLITAALDKPADEAERVTATAAAIEYLLATNQVARADELVKPMLEDSKLSRRPGLWRLASQIAQRRGQVARAITCLENALEMEFQNLPNVINLQQVRQDYGTLLQHYESLASAVVAMKIDPPSDLAARTIRAADRWRALDRDNGEVCEQAARILKTLGANEMAWDYITTPIGMRPNEAGPWHQLAQRLTRQGENNLADLAYKAAFEAEPTDAQLLWDRALNLQQAGKRAEANTVLKQIKDGEWQPRFAWLKSQAQWQLEGR